MPSSDLRQRLRAEGHVLKPVVRIGTNGLVDAVMAQVRGALEAHELIKIAVSGDAPEDRFEVADQLAKAGIAIVQIVGRTILAYQPAPKRDKPKGPRSKATRRTKSRPAKSSGGRPDAGPPRAFGGRRKQPSR